MCRLCIPDMGSVGGIDVDVDPPGSQEVTVGCGVDLGGPDVDVLAVGDIELFGKLTTGVRRAWKVVSADDNLSSYEPLSSSDIVRLIHIECKR